MSHEQDAPVALIIGRRLAELPWLRSALAEVGARLELVDTGDAALDALAGTLPDLVLADTGPLGGVDGFEVCRRLAAVPQTAPLPVLLVAGEADEALLARALEAGARELLTPRENRHLLTLRLRAALAAKRVCDARDRQLDDLRSHAAGREALLRVSLMDLDVMLTAARRATALLAESDAAALSTDGARCLRVATGELAAAVDTIHSLEAVRALAAGEWHFEPDACEPAAVLAAATAGAPRAQCTVEPGLALLADAELLAYALAAMVQHALSRAGADAPIELHARRREPSGVCFELRVGGGLREPREAPIAGALQLTLAQMVAQAHGGMLRYEPAAPACLALDLPPEPTARTWPPTGVFSRGARAEAGSGPSAAGPAADWLASRTVLPAPPRPPRLLPPARD